MFRVIEKSLPQKMYPHIDWKMKQIESHNNDRVEEFVQVETNKNMKPINRQCGTYNVKFQISKALSTNNLIH